MAHPLGNALGLRPKRFPAARTLSFPERLAGLFSAFILYEKAVLYNVRQTVYTKVPRSEDLGTAERCGLIYLSSAWAAFAVAKAFSSLAVSLSRSRSA